MNDGNLPVEDKQAPFTKDLLTVTRTSTVRKFLKSSANGARRRRKALQLRNKGKDVENRNGIVDIDLFS